MLFTNGCSFTEGYDLPDFTCSWPHQLAELCESPVTNLALGGASNDRITRTTKEWLCTNSADLIVIGWTQYDRNELSHHKGLYVRCHGSVCLPESDHVPDDADTIHKNWLLYNHNLWLNYRNWLYDVLFWQKFFSQTKQKYVFFTAFEDNYIQDFIQGTDRALELADLSYQWRDRKKYAPEKTIHTEYKELVNLANQINLDGWILPFSSMGKSLELQGYKVDHTGHYLEDGHQRWAQQLYEKIITL